MRATPGGLETVADWLVTQRLELEGVSPMGIGHRFVRDADPGPGKVVVDLLAPEGLAERTRVFTIPPARTVAVPASSALIGDRVATSVTLASGATGTIHRPSVLAALVGKAAATKLPHRTDRERDWQDAALLLALLPDPLAVASQLTTKDRRRLRALGPLTDASHPAWLTLTADQRRQGVAAAKWAVP